MKLIYKNMKLIYRNMKLIYRNMKLIYGNMKLVCGKMKYGNTYVTTLEKTINYVILGTVNLKHYVWLISLILKRSY